MYDDGYYLADRVLNSISSKFGKRFTKEIAELIIEEFAERPRTDVEDGAFTCACEWAGDKEV